MRACKKRLHPHLSSGFGGVFACLLGIVIHGLPLMSELGRQEFGTSWQFA